MKMTRKIRTLSLLFAVIFAILWSRGEIVAAEGIDSSISFSGTGSSFSNGVPDYPLNLIIAGNYTGTILSTTSPYTVLAFTIFETNSGGGQNNYLTCGGNPIFPNTGLFDSEADDLNVSSPYSYSISYQLHCSSDLGVVGFGNIYWEVQYVPYDTRMIQSTSTMPLTDTHFGIIAEYAFAFASFVFIIWLFKKRI